MLHGAFLIIHRGFQVLCKRHWRLDAAMQSVPGTVGRVVVTFLCVCVGWVFFRSTTFGAASEFLHRLVVPHEGQGSPLHNRSLWYTVIVMAVCHALGQSGLWKKVAPRVPAPVLGLGYAVVLTLALVLAPDAGKAFIYFQF
jgi:alginate O-acetyltransferase complex protein AlgI